MLPSYHPSRQASHPRVQLVRLAAMLRGGKGGKGGGRRRTALALNASFTPCAILTMAILTMAVVIRLHYLCPSGMGLQPNCDETAALRSLACNPKRGACNPTAPRLQPQVR